MLRRVAVHVVSWCLLWSRTFVSYSMSYFNVAQESKRGLVITQFCGNFCVLLLCFTLCLTRFCVLFYPSTLFASSHGRSRELIFCVAHAGKAPPR